MVFCKASHYFTWSGIPHGCKAFNRLVPVLWKGQPLLGDLFWYVESNFFPLVLLQWRTLLMDCCLSKSFSLWPRISGKRKTQEEAPLPASLNPVSIFGIWTWETNCWEHMTVIMKILFTPQKLWTSWKNIYIWSKKKKIPIFPNPLLNIELSLISKPPFSALLFAPIFIAGKCNRWARQLSALFQNPL